jgi:two-component system, NarL family, sensor histidine kinase UhpB
LETPRWRRSQTPDHPRNAEDAVAPSVWRDLVVVVGVTVGTFIVSSALELNERVIAFTRPFEAYEVDELPTTFVAMIVALAWFSWRRSREAVQQANLRLAAQRQLAEALSENRRLSQRYLKVQEEERRFLARELHDELGQSLNAIKVDAVNIRDATSESGEIRRSADAIIDVSSKVYEVVRTLLRQLRPVALDELGLATAVQYFVEEWQRRHPAVKCELSIDGELEGLDEDINITAYRFVQECMTNVARHAHAGRVRVLLRITREDAAPAIALSVEDDGRGVDSKSRRTGLGLIGLRERIESLGGRFRIEPAERNGGTRVSAVVALRGHRVEAAK